MADLFYAREVIEQQLKAFFCEQRRDPDLLISDPNEVRLDGRAEWISTLIERRPMTEEDHLVFGHFRDGGETIIDVGANYGYSVTSIWGVGATASFLSFEPIQPYRLCLEQIARARPGFYDYRMVGLSDSRGELSFAMPVINGIGQSALTTAETDLYVPSMIDDLLYNFEHYMGGAEFNSFKIHCFKAPVTTLDAVLVSEKFRVPTSRIVAIKIDVEGHEASVLRGAIGVIRRHRPLLMLERANGQPEISAILQVLGYVCTEREADRLRRVERIPANVNTFFIARDRIEEYMRTGLLATS
jgi:FkbM family methyltransferase